MQHSWHLRQQNYSAAGYRAKQSHACHNGIDEGPTRTIDVSGRDNTARGLGQALDAGNGGLGRNPSYGSPRQGAVSALGRHYSTVDRQALNGSAFGQGVRGAVGIQLENKLTGA